VVSWEEALQPLPMSEAVASADEQKVAYTKVKVMWGSAWEVVVVVVMVNLVFLWREEDSTVDRTVARWVEE